MNKWLLILANVAIAAAVLLSIPYLQERRRPHELNNEAVTAINGGRYDEAIDALTQARLLLPDDENIQQNLLAAHKRKASDLSQSTNTAAALVAVEEGLKLAPEDQDLLNIYVTTLNNMAVDSGDKHEFTAAQQYFEQATTKLPELGRDDVRDNIRENYSALLTLWGSELMKTNQTTAAVHSFEQALQLDRENSIAMISLGDLAYEENRYDVAKKVYTQALPLDSENGHYLRNRLSMIEDESLVEATFKQIIDGNRRFLIQHVDYTNGVPVQDIMDILNEAYDSIGKDLGVYPARTVNVKIYKAEDFVRIAKLPEWAIGIFDGKMRLKVDEIQTARSQVRDLLFHEYTHAVLAMNIKQTVPAWFHEGMAQLFEPQFKESAREQAQMREALARNQLNFESLSDSFREITSQGEAENAYLLSKYFLAYLNREYGHDKLTGWVGRLTRDENFEKAFASEYDMSLPEAQKAWIDAQLKKLGNV